MPTRKTSRKTAAVKQKPSPVRGFKTPSDLREWLDRNHDKSPGLWLRIAKKDSGIKSVTYAEALDVILCYGWIDALKLPENDKTWLQRILPRRPKSIWSKINREKAIGLIESGLMHSAGLAEIERAKTDGRWESAYDSPSRATIHPEFQAELDRNPKARAFFETLSRTNRYAVLWRIQTAKKPETRQARIRTYIAMLEKGEKFH
ncbi:MAG TPA: YdeI/OmpD-associated family protein [Gemmatimonadaceae bacterium]|nr:YdeI/OmpD-associated family protein [Gemmatimonadaceae bacterium]